MLGGGGNSCISSCTLPHVAFGPGEAAGEPQGRSIDGEGNRPRADTAAAVGAAAPPAAGAPPFPGSANFCTAGAGPGTGDVAGQRQLMLLSRIAPPMEGPYIAPPVEALPRPL